MVSMEDCGFPLYLSFHSILKLFFNTLSAHSGHLRFPLPFSHFFIFQKLYTLCFSNLFLLLDITLCCSYPFHFCHIMDTTFCFLPSCHIMEPTLCCSYHMATFRTLNSIVLTFLSHSGHYTLSLIPFLSHSGVYALFSYLLVTFHGQCALLFSRFCYIFCFLTFLSHSGHYSLFSYLLVTYRTLNSVFDYLFCHI
jgi:hypothetical protein